MRRLGELAGPDVAEEAYFPVALTLLFEIALGPGESAPLIGTPN